jgi:undecaprenyl-phosphate 4-deoxy-4-formamido-L-arabinose transferase
MVASSSEPTAPDAGAEMVSERPGFSGISVVVPAYRSSATLPLLVAELRRCVEPLVEHFEIVIVDDGSGDGTWATIQQLALDNDSVRGLQLLRNYGQHNALLAGIRDARQPLVLTIDDDLQHPPHEVGKLLAALGPGVDLVYGRAEQERQGALRNAASRLGKWAMAASLGPDVYPRSGAFRLFRRQLVAASAEVHDPSLSIDVLLSWATNRIVDVPVEHQDRSVGRSGYSFTRLVKHMANMVTGYSSRPLRMVSILGVFTAFLGFALLLYVVVRFIVSGSDVAGFTFLAATVTLFSGVQLLSLGVLGEYLSRVHFRSMGKPVYIVRETTDDPDR